MTRPFPVLLTPWLTVCGLLALGCAPVAEPAAPEREPSVVCEAEDAGDQAWLRRAMAALIGRGPYGHQELLALEGLVQQAGRDSMASVLMEDEAFVDRWSPWLMDFAGVNRVGLKDHRQCFQTPAFEGTASELLARLRADPSGDWDTAGTFNMADVLRLSLTEDDVSLFLRANIFAMFARPAVYCGNTPAEEMELTRRREFATKFTPIYTGRSRECLACHNSAFSVTDSAVPDEDRHWPLPGRLEAAVFGADVGLDELTSAAVFRFMGVAGDDALVDEEEREDWPESNQAYRSPWGMHASCGTLAPASAVTPDPLGYESYLAGELGNSASIWDVERQLATGLASLASSPPDWDADAVPDGPRALAYMVAARLADAVWTEVVGTPLTLSHGFPRNAEQRDTLERLTSELIASQWSLRALLRAVLADPFFNPVAPAESCVGQSHPLAPVLDPFSVHAVSASERGNSLGDGVVRTKPWVLLGKTHHPLGWPLPEVFPEDDTVRDYEVLRASGAFLADDRPGYRGFDFQTMVDWEYLMHPCRPEPEGLREGCEGTDEDCLAFPQDWVDTLVSEARASNASVRDLMVAIKDRLWALPTLDATEEQLVEALIGQKLHYTLGPVNSVQMAARSFCGVLLSAPQTLLSGVVPEPLTEPVPGVVLVGESQTDYCQRWAQRAAGVDISVACGTTPNPSPTP